MSNRTTAAGIRPLVVIADDDELIRTVVRFSLEELNLSVLEASSGAETIAAVQQHDVALIVLDVHFPGEVFEGLWAELNADQQNRPAVILLSGDLTAPTASGDSRVEYLKKPVELAQLQASVARLLASSSAGQTP